MTTAHLGIDSLSTAHVQSVLRGRCLDPHQLSGGYGSYLALSERLFPTEESGNISAAVLSEQDMLMVFEIAHGSDRKVGLW